MVFHFLCFAKFQHSFCPLCWSFLSKYQPDVSNKDCSDKKAYTLGQTTEKACTLGQTTEKAYTLGQTTEKAYTLGQTTEKACTLLSSPVQNTSS